MGWNKALATATAAIVAWSMMGASFGGVAYGEPENLTPADAQEEVVLAPDEQPVELELTAMDDEDKIPIECCEVEVPDVIWDGEPVAPDPIVTYEGRVLIAGVDYTVEYRDNNRDDVDACVIVHGMGDFGSESQCSFYIPKRDLWHCTVSEIPDQQWNGVPLCPKPVVTYNGRTLVEGVDYLVSYDLNETPEYDGASVILRGIGDFASEEPDLWVWFNIVGAKDISWATASCVESLKWTGKPLRPKVTVTYEGVTLKEGRDYEIRYGENVDSGVGTFTVTGKGSYWNTLEGGFVIEGEQLRFATVSPIPDQKWTGKEVKPKPKVTYNGKVLTEGVDYILTYENNINPCVEATGPNDENSAYVTISGKGQYTGNLVFSFAICRAGTWKQTNGKWWYRYPNGTYPKNCDRTIDGKRYCFDKSGYMVTGWQKRWERWVYFKKSGAMAHGWLKISGSWYYFEPYSGYMCVGLVSIGADDYVFDQRSGVMLTGWQNPLGRMWFYLKPSGAAVKGWNKIGGTWYYFDDTIMSTGWKKVSGIWYYFKSSGAMVTGWQQIGGKWYYFSSSGAMAVNKWQGNYWLGSNGAMVKNAWVDGGKYYVGSNGAWVKGKTK